MNYGDADQLYAAIGERHVSSQSVAARLLKLKAEQEGIPEARNQR